MSGNSEHSFQEVADRYMLDHCYYPLVLSDSLVFDRPFRMIVSPISDARRTARLHKMLYSIMHLVIGFHTLQNLHGLKSIEI